MSERVLAVVTGASSGIGAELSRQLSRRGFEVLAIARRAERLRELAKEVEGAGGSAIHPLVLDIAAEGAAEQAAAAAARIGRTGWLVNNAGLLQLGAALEIRPQRQLEQVRLNCEALVAMTAAFLPVMVERKQGIVLNVASTAGFQPTPQMAVYGASKAFVISYSEALAVELRGSGVSVTALCPGPVTTELFDVGAPGVLRKKPPHEISAEQCARFGIRAAEQRRVIAVPGFRNQVSSAFMRLAPRWVVRGLVGKLGLWHLGYSRST